MGFAERLRAELARDASPPSLGAIGTIGSGGNRKKEPSIPPIGTTGTTGSEVFCPDEVAEREAIQGEPPPRPFTQSPPNERLVDALAVAMSRKPGVTMTDPERAMDYFRASARNRLARIDDPMVRGLLVGFETHRAAAGPVKT